jgi:hypothetical protein
MTGLRQHYGIKNKFDTNVSFDLTLGQALSRLVAQNKKSATNDSLRIEICSRFRATSWPFPHAGAGFARCGNFKRNQRTTGPPMV